MLQLYLTKVTARALLYNLILLIERSLTALEIIQEDYKTETKNIDDRISIQVYPPADSNIPSEKTSAKRYNMAAEPQQPAVRGFILYKIANVFTNQRHF